MTTVTPMTEHIVNVRRLKNTMELYGVTKNFAAGDEVYDELHNAGVETFHDFITLSKEDITSLSLTKLMTSRRLIQIQAFYHFASLTKRQDVAIDVMKSDMLFKEFLISEYDPNSDVVPWKVAIQREEKARIKEAKKSIEKPNPDKFPKLRDEKMYPKWLKDTRQQFQLHDMEYTIDRTVTKPSILLFETMKKVATRILLTQVVLEKGKVAMEPHITANDSIAMYETLVATLRECMSSKLYASKISNFLTGVRFGNINWRGTQEGFLLNYQTQYRTHSEISTAPYTELQACEFLQAAVAGVPNLASVWASDQAARAASGITTNVTLSGYVQQLLTAAQTYDAGRIGSNRRQTRSANQHAMLPPSESINVNYHNADTDIDHMMALLHEGEHRIYQEIYTADTNDHGSHFQDRRKPDRMTGKTWHSLDRSDQIAWDKLSKEGKAKILQSLLSNERSVNLNDMVDSNDSIKANNHETDELPAGSSSPVQEEGSHSERIQVTSAKLLEASSEVKEDPTPTESTNQNANGNLETNQEQYPYDGHGLTFKKISQSRNGIPGKDMQGRTGYLDEGQGRSLRVHCCLRR